MTPEKRNHIISNFTEALDRCLQDTQYPSMSMSQRLLDAIRECYRRAMAWDELRKWARDQMCTDLTCTKMDELIPPEPVDKLERLRQWLLSHGKTEGCGLGFGYLLSKIKELQDEDR